MVRSVDGTNSEFVATYIQKQESSQSVYNFNFMQNTPYHTEKIQTINKKIKLLLSTFLHPEYNFQLKLLLTSHSFLISSNLFYLLNL